MYILCVEVHDDIRPVTDDRMQGADEVEESLVLKEDMNNEGF